MDLRTINSFVQVAELKSFTKAAMVLGYSQSSVSVQIRQLEEEVGGPLFERINHTVAITKEGERLLKTAREIQLSISKFEKESLAGQKPSGKVRIATSDSLGRNIVEKVFPILNRKYPQISMEVKTGGTGELFRMLNQNEADLVYTLDVPTWNRDYVVLEENESKVYFVVSAKHPLAGKEVKVEEILEYPLLLTEKSMSYRRVLEEELAKRHLSLNPSLESGNTELLCSILKDGVGVSFLPEYVIQKGLIEKELEVIKVEGIFLTVWGQLLHHKDKWISPAIEVVAEEICAQDPIRKINEDAQSRL
ncbi:MAG TPA: LysR family transcriptional regulator [Lachnospiraceae bacterium]